MPSTYESTFGTRINNAEILLNNLKSFTTYQALNQESSVTYLENLIVSIHSANSTEASKLQAYTLAVDVRQKHLLSDETSLKKLITPINGYIKAQYGAKSKEATTINEQVVKIRGGSASKMKPNPDEKSISKSQQSYASLTKGFADLIASLEVLSPAYLPPNQNIRLDVLKTKLLAIQQASNQISTLSTELSTIRNQRNELYNTMKDSCLRIKEAVKSQYGTNATEYKLIKGLSV